jgi:hypothetical protein
MADQVVIFTEPPEFVPRNIGDDDTFQAMATFRALPGNKLELVAIDNQKLGGGTLTGPLRIARTAARSQPLPAGAPGAAPPGAVPALGAPTAASPNFASSLMQRFRAATGRR